MTTEMGRFWQETWFFGGRAIDVIISQKAAVTPDFFSEIDHAPGESYAPAHCLFDNLRFQPPEAINVYQTAEGVYIKGFYLSGFANHRLSWPNYRSFMRLMRQDMRQKSNWLREGF